MEVKLDHFPPAGVKFHKKSLKPPTTNKQSSPSPSRPRVLFSHLIHGSTNEQGWTATHQFQGLSEHGRFGSKRNKSIKASRKFLYYKYKYIYIYECTYSSVFFNLFNKYAHKNALTYTWVYACMYSKKPAIHV